MAGYPPGMPWGMAMHGAHAALQQLPQRPAALPIEALGLMIGSRIEVRASSERGVGPSRQLPPPLPPPAGGCCANRGCRARQQSERAACC